MGGVIQLLEDGVGCNTGAGHWGRFVTGTVERGGWLVTQLLGNGVCVGGGGGRRCVCDTDRCLGMGVGARRGGGVNATGGRDGVVVAPSAVKVTARSMSMSGCRVSPSRPCTPCGGPDHPPPSSPPWSACPSAVRTSPTPSPSPPPPSCASTASPAAGPPSSTSRLRLYVARVVVRVGAGGVR